MRVTERHRRDRRLVVCELEGAERTYTASDGKTVTYTPETLTLRLTRLDGEPWSLEKSQQGFVLTGPSADQWRGVEVLKRRTAPQWALDLLDKELARE